MRRFSFVRRGVVGIAAAAALAIPATAGLTLTSTSAAFAANCYTTGAYFPAPGSIGPTVSKGFTYCQDFNIGYPSSGDEYLGQYLANGNWQNGSRGFVVVNQGQGYTALVTSVRPTTLVRAVSLLGGDGATYAY